MRTAAAMLLLVFASCGGEPPPPPDPGEHPMTEPLLLDADRVGPMVSVILEWVRREFPHHFYAVLEGEEELVPPREMHPAFYGCFDWHSAVHMHWALVRFLRDFPEHPLAGDARAVLAEHLTDERVAGEVAFFERPRNRSLERPYGWAWLLALRGELLRSGEPGAARWAEALRPLADLLAGRTVEWLAVTNGPNRTGVHGNSAYSLSLMLDYARTAGDRALEEAVLRASRRFFAADAGWPAWIEPLGPDFLSPGLAEAELMGRILEEREFAAWLERFLPRLGQDPDAPIFRPVSVGAPEDPFEGHLIGLAFHRATALRRIAAALPPDDPRRSFLLRAARRNAEAGLAQVEGSGWGGDHWLPSFAIRALSPNP